MSEQQQSNQPAPAPDAADSTQTASEQLSNTQPTTAPTDAMNPVELTEDGLNARMIVCRRCGCKILRPGHAKFEQHKVE